VCSVEADTSSVEAEFSSATAATSETLSSIPWVEAVICAIAVLTWVTRSFMSLTELPMSSNLPRVSSTVCTPSSVRAFAQAIFCRGVASKGLSWWSV
jgi:hypothetical protein